MVDTLSTILRGIRIHYRNNEDLNTARCVIEHDEYGITSLQRAPEIVIDVGAGIGDFTLLCLNRFPRCKVYAFEPCKESFHVLQKNLATCGSASRVHSFRCGLSGYTDELLTMKRRPVDNGGNYIQELCNYEGFEAPPDLTENVQTMSVKTFGDLTTLAPFDYTFQSQRTLLKIDTEGCEYQILHALGESLKNLYYLALEWHNHERKLLWELLQSKGIDPLVRGHQDEWNGLMFAYPRGES